MASPATIDEAAELLSAGPGGIGKLHPRGSLVAAERPPFFALFPDEFGTLFAQGDGPRKNGKISPIHES